MKGKTFNTFLYLVVLLACTLNGNKFFASTGCYMTHDELFEQIIDDKLYLKPGTLVVAENSLYHLVKGQLIPLNFVEVDEGGIYTRSMGYPYGFCPFCDWPLTPWGTCANPDCLTNN